MAVGIRVKTLWNPGFTPCNLVTLVKSLGLFFFFKVFFFFDVGHFNVFYHFCFMFWCFGREACGILAPQPGRPGTKPDPLLWKGKS